MASGNDIAYLPSVTEIENRRDFQNLLRDNAWSADLVVSIMIHEMPSIETAKGIIGKYGHDLAKMKIKHFLRANK